MREETRRQRYENKFQTAQKLPISLCAINFQTDNNLGHLIRTAACFGASQLYVVGHVPPRSRVKASSGSLVDYVEIVQFTTPQDFLEHAKNTGVQIVSAELVEGARPLSTYNFNFDSHLCLVVGNEQTGIPAEITHRSQLVYINMPGVGYCLNTAQAANILLYEAAKQYTTKKAQAFGAN